MTIEDLIIFSADQLVEEKGLGAKSYVDQLIADSLEKGNDQETVYYKHMKQEVERLLVI